MTSLFFLMVHVNNTLIIKILEPKNHLDLEIRKIIWIIHLHDFGFQINYPRAQGCIYCNAYVGNLIKPTWKVRK